MRGTRAAALVALWAGCIHPIPDHLRVDPPPVQPAPGEAGTATDSASAVAALVARDPLVRAPAIPVPIPADAPWLQAYADALRAVDAGTLPADALSQLADDWDATPAVALARGVRLRVAENVLARSSTLDEAAQGEVLRALTPLVPTTGGGEPPRPPLDWMLAGGDPRTSIQTVGERWVLTGWLASPAVPLTAVAASLGAPMYDGLRQTPLGRIVVARGGDASGDPAPGLLQLHRATALALQRVAADRDGEQTAYAKAKTALATELDAADPEAALLTGALAALTPLARDDRAAGGALLALSALRWNGDCSDQPCVGVDRVETMGFAGRFSAETAGYAAVWQTIALKDALDSMDVGADTVMFPTAALSLTDALLGTGAGPIESRLVEVRRPDPGVWLVLCRSVASDGCTDWPSTRSALGAHLRKIADSAILISPDPTWVPWLKQISVRAVP